MYQEYIFIYEFNSTAGRSSFELSTFINYTSASNEIWNIWYLPKWVLDIIEIEIEINRVWYKLEWSLSLKNVRMMCIEKCEIFCKEFQDTEFFYVKKYLQEKISRRNRILLLCSYIFPHIRRFCKVLLWI